MGFFGAVGEKEEVTQIKSAKLTRQPSALAAQRQLQTYSQDQGQVYFIGKGIDHRRNSGESNIHLALFTTMIGL